MQLKKSIAKPDHPYHNFGTGNLETLKELPLKASINLRERLLEFHARYYSSNQMRLVVLGKDSLDNLARLVEDCFSNVPNKVCLKKCIIVCLF
jgi:insulysin